MPYIVTSDTPPLHLSVSTRLVYYFLRLYEKENGRGAKKEEILYCTQISDRTFDRVWQSLKEENLIAQKL